MKPASLAQIKKELITRDPQELFEICLRLARFKKDNKELLTYLLFEAADEQGYINLIKETIDDEISEINRSHIYYAKKSLRKIQRNLNKYVRYSGNKQTEIEILIYFAKSIKDSGLDIRGYTALFNMYERLLVRINKVKKKLHEDLQADYQVEIDELVSI
ncbi:hypothetical protein OO013_09870 [Mangrovivirga sp. M17]|uniref:Uncharacterized protein n=1 Tax=Mangrovivirga halotolerans TaxID=2993936 RepID=A0ABT3RQW7_9BACT|nr:hypothetical protein [Mangrovivirga halotolerans]MCX2744173.1 hypothetical protein [Mangrovivirga halotolerans]